MTGTDTSCDVRLVYITTDGTESARAIARTLVKERLAACANVLNPMISVYRWNGAVHEDRETVLIAKTAVSRVEELTARVKALHAYECPCVVSVPVDGGNQAFLVWVDAETAASDAGGD